jgi:hypothetical protein
MSIFICNFAGCPNENIEYNFGEDSPEWAECGGCQARLESIND